MGSVGKSGWWARSCRDVASATPPPQTVGTPGPTRLVPCRRAHAPTLVTSGWITSTRRRTSSCRKGWRVNSDSPVARRTPRRRSRDSPDTSSAARGFLEPSHGQVGQLPAQIGGLLDGVGAVDVDHQFPVGAENLAGGPNPLQVSRQAGADLDLDRPEAVGVRLRPRTVRGEVIIEDDVAGRGVWHDRVAGVTAENSGDLMPAVRARASHTAASTPETATVERPAGAPVVGRVAETHQLRQRRLHREPDEHRTGLLDQAAHHRRRTEGLTGPHQARLPVNLDDRALPSPDPPGAESYSGPAQG